MSGNLARIVTAWVIGVHLVLLPALYLALGYVIRTSHEEMFVQNIRTFARVLGDELEVGAALDSRSLTEDLLDLAIIHGECRYAEVTGANGVVRSKLGLWHERAPRPPDTRFGEGGNDTYSIVLPITHQGRLLDLRLGFNEQPTRAKVETALHRMLWLMALYLCVTIGIAIYLTSRLSHPMRSLQIASRSIASGNYLETLHVPTMIRELRELGDDLEIMRRELVGFNDRLLDKIQEKEFAESQRETLERQLRHRQRMETVGTLAAGIAHEFNNVLLPIVLFTELVAGKLAADNPLQSHLQRVLMSARRAKDMVRKILAFSHVLGDAALVPTDLRAVVNEAVTLFSTFATVSIETRAVVPDDLPLVRADPALALDLIMNLCTNAYQAMQGRPGALTVGLRVLETPPDRPEQHRSVELWVTDTGHGIDQQTVERMFEPFFTTRAVGQGTGLGLSVVHGIVESFGARIAVETAPGAGATFRIEFPAITAPPDDSRPV